MPDRDMIEATFERMLEYSAADDMVSWVGCFAEDASFINSALPEPVAGRDAITAMAVGWPRFHNEVEWQVIDGARLVIGWREHQLCDDGGVTGWYRGMSTFVFDDAGNVKEYEGVFDLVAVQAALRERAGG